MMMVILVVLQIASRQSVAGVALGRMQPSAPCVCWAICFVSIILGRHHELIYVHCGSLQLASLANMRLLFPLHWIM